MYISNDGYYKMKRWLSDYWVTIVFIVIFLTIASGFPIEYYKGNERIQIMREQ